MTVTVNHDNKLTIDDTAALDLDNVTDVPFRHTIGNHSGSRTATSTVKCTKGWSDTFDLAAGAKTLDLTALTNGNLPNVTLTGLKIKNLKVACPSSNSAGVVIAPGASNAHDVFGTASDRVTVAPGQVHGFDFADEGETVDATHKTWDLSSADQDATMSIILAAGGT